MPLNDVRQVKNPITLCKDNVPSHRIKATKKIFQYNTPDFINSQEWAAHSTDLNLNRFESRYIIQFEVSCKNLSLIHI